MKILAFDAGNTHIQMGCIEDGEIRAVIRFHTDPAETCSEYCVQVSRLLDFYGIRLQEIDGCIVSSVVPEVTEELKEAAYVLTGAVPMVVGPGMKTGLNVRIDDPGTLAGNLLASSVAALAEYEPPLIILDMSTATTLTVLDLKGSFRGGAILPGLRISLDALSSRAGLLPDISLTKPAHAIGTNTVECMRAGAIYGTAGSVDGIITRFQEELGYPCRVIATGHAASAVVPYCRHDISLDPQLVLKGLWLLYVKNIRKKP